MKTMKKTIKRILAVVCAVTLLISGLSAAGFLKKTALADDAHSVISIATGDVGYKQSGGFFNVNYTDAPMDYKRGTDFLDEAFVEKYVSFSGGMTAEDLFEGKNIFYLATDGIIQYNWANRGKAFEKGWTFTIAQGTLIPYITTAEETAYVELDAEYTYEFKAGRDGYDNIVNVSKQKIVTYGMREGVLVGNGLSDGTGTIFTLSGENIKDFITKYNPMQEDEIYADYIDFGGASFSKWQEKGLQFRYVLDGATKCIQVEKWGDFRNDLAKGDQIVFKKGMPIFYMGTDGVEYKALLDATYVYHCIGSNAEHSQVFRSIKYSASHQAYGITTMSYGTATQGEEWYSNISFDQASAGTISPSIYVSEDIFGQQLAEEYVDIAGMTLKKARNAGMKLRFIPSANVLQLTFGEEAMNTLKVGDRIIFKKGLPVFYEDGSKMESATLKNEYMFTIISNTGNALQLTCEISESFALADKLGARKEEAGCYYFDALFTKEMFKDAKANFEGNFEDQQKLFEKYFEVSGKTASELINEGWYLRRYNLPGVFVGMRFYCPTAKFDLASGDYVMFKEGFPITYKTEDGQNKVVYADSDYGYRYNGTEFVYDESLNPGDEGDKPVSSVVNKFGLDTSLVGTFDENGIQTMNVTITDQPFTVKNRLALDISGDQIESPVSGVTAQVILESADVQVLQVKLTDEAVNSLNVGDRITFKKNLSIAYNPEKPDEVAKLDDKYVLRVTAKEGKQVTFQVELTGTYGFAEVFYHAEVYMDVHFAAGSDLSDAIAFENATIDDTLMKEYLQIAEHTHEDLKAQGYRMAAYCVPALKGVRINYQNFDLTAGTVLLLKEGMPITYTTTAGKTKTVYLDRTYGYTKNEQTAFVFDPTLTEIKETEYLTIGLADEAGSYTEVDGSERINLSLSNGIIEASQYIQANILDDVKAREFISTDAYTAEQLSAAGAKILFIPTAGVIQFAPGTLSWDDVQKITFEKGLEVPFFDNGPKRAVLDDTYVYKIKKDGNRHIITRVQDYKVKITVDGVEVLNGKYKVGTKLDLAQYANTSKGKVMTIKVNDVSIQEKTLVVKEHADVVIENRSDLCVVVFKDGKETIVVKEYKLSDKKLDIPYAPDKNGYDDSWEDFKLKNGVVTVQAIHTKKQLEPVVKISGAVRDGAEGAKPETETGKTEGGAILPNTGDSMQAGVWAGVSLLAMMAIAFVLLTKKRKTL